MNALTNLLKLGTDSLRARIAKIDGELERERKALLEIEQERDEATESALSGDELAVKKAAKAAASARVTQDRIEDLKRARDRVAEQLADAVLKEAATKRAAIVRHLEALASRRLEMLQRADQAIEALATELLGADAMAVEIAGMVQQIGRGITRADAGRLQATLMNRMQALGVFPDGRIVKGRAATLAEVGEESHALIMRQLQETK